MSSAELLCRGPVSSHETSAHFKCIRKRERVTKRGTSGREPTFTTALRTANHKMAVHHLLSMNCNLT